MKTQILLAAAIVGAACRPTPLTIGTGHLTDGPSLSVVAATFGDDLLQLVAADGCQDLITFRNFPSWQFDSCDTCFGKPIGSGILSSSGPLCGHASGSDWVSVGECGAELTVEKSVATELSGTLRIARSLGGTLTLEFRAARRVMQQQPGTSKMSSLCDSSGADRLAGAVCCNWTQDERCAQQMLDASCLN